MAGYTYNTYVVALKSAAVSGVNDATFDAYINSTVIPYAEQRIYRELDLLSTVTTDSTSTFTSGVRSLTLPTSPRFVTVQQINVITPAGTAPNAGTRNPMLVASKEVLDVLWPSATGAARPQNFAMLTDQTILVGPWPDSNYTVEVVGTIRPDQLSSTNPTTFLSQYLPDLFFAASMISVAGYQRNYGSQSDDPKMSQSWEAQYQSLKASANLEEMRKKWAGPDWTSMSPTPLAGVPR